MQRDNRQAGAMEQKGPMSAKQLLFGVVLVVLVLGTLFQIVSFLNTPEYEWQKCNPEGGPVVNEDWQACE